VKSRQNVSLNSVKHWLSYDIVRFIIDVGVEEKFMSKYVTKQTQHSDYHSSSKAGRHIDDLDLTAQRRQHTKAVLAE